MKAVTALCLPLFLFIAGAAGAGAAPSLVYSTFLGGEGRDFVSDVAVDSAGNAYVLGFLDSPGSGYFVAKLSPLGELIFLRQLEKPYPRAPWAIALGPRGHIYIAGTANRSDVGSEANEGFVAMLTPDGRGSIHYDTLFSDGTNTLGVDLAVDSLGQAYVQVVSGYSTRSSVFRFSPEGTLNGGTGGGPYHVAAMALDSAGNLFTVGWLDFQDIYLERVDASSGAVVEILLGESGTLLPVDIAGVPGGGAVVVGEKSGGLHVARYGPAGEEVFSRFLNVGALEVRDVAVTSSGEIVLAVHARSVVSLDILLLRLDGGTGRIVSSTTLAGSRDDFANAVAAGPGGDAFVAGSTHSPDFPTANPLQPLRGPSDGFISRVSENRAPHCSGATASPSVIWPPNGKMVPVSILGVTDPDGDPVSLKITGITQDEPGAAFSGIGSPVARVKAERDGKGDGRVYRILFEATDLAGASCTGEVRVCVPHDRGKGNCGDSAR